ncbi:MAG: PAS domain-containing protein, partial [Planctomycetota bacterium]
MMQPLSSSPWRTALAELGFAVAVLAPVALGGRTPLAFALSALVALGAVLARALRRRREVLEPLAAATSALEQAAEGRAPAGLLAMRACPPVHALLRALDRAAQRVAEQLGRMRLEREELAAILSAMEEGVVAIDAADRVIELNAAACELIDAPAGAAPGQPLWEVNRLAALREALVQARADGVQRRFELVVVGPGGERRVNVHVAPLLADRSATADATARGARGAVALLRDTTRERALERDRRRFLSDVSHELKTPIATIRALAQALLGDAHDASQRGLLERIEAQTRRLEQLVEDLLSLERMDTRRDGEPPRPVDLAAIVEQAVADIEPAAQRAGLRLDCDVPDDPVVVHGRQRALRRMVDALVENAIKYTASAGREVAVGLTAEQRLAVLRVEDDGIGIEPDHLDRIFERFYRADSARTRGRGGSGLGLAIARQVAVAHGGEITVESRP